MTLAQVFVGTLMSDLDFFVSFMHERINIDLGLLLLYQDLDYFKDLMDDDERALYKEVLSRPEKLTKEELVRAIESVLNDKAKLEGFMIAFTGADDELVKVFESIDRVEDYEMIKKDKVYQKRRAYINTLASVAKAAVNLYGVIAIEDVYDIIEHYDLIKIEGRGYQKKSGTYKKTIFASPKHFSMSILHIYIELMGSRINFTNDGLLLDQCFASEFDQEFTDFYEKFKDGIVDDDAYNKLLDEYDERFSYRRFHIESLMKPLWLPESADEFLLYSSGMAMEVSNVADELFDYIDKHLLRRMKIPNAGGLPDFMLKDVAKYDIVERCMQLVNDHNAKIEPDLNVAYDGLVEYLKNYHVRLKEDEKYDIRLILASLHDEVRLWQNRGYTNKELEEGVKTEQLHPSDLERYLDDLFSHKMEDFSGDEEETIDPKTGKKIIKVKRAMRTDMKEKR